jgi:DNA modification methylase
VRVVTAIVTRGNAADLHLPDESVDLIVTSPPYFGLRSYQDGGEHYAGQVGAEATPREYLDALIACTREWMRVLKPGGSIFVNLGDKYATAGTRQGNKGNTDGISVVETAKHYGRRPEGFRDKSLMMLPQRYAIRCIDELGLILRAEIVWAKPNGLPESVTDRVRRQHEQVFHFVKQSRYYAAVDSIREPHTMTPQRRLTQPPQIGAYAGQNKQTMEGRSERAAPSTDGNPLGKLPGSVWTIPTSPLRVPAELGIDHFAAYPPELVRRIVLGWSPREVCSACGEGRRPVSERKATSERRRGYSADSWNAGTLVVRGSGEATDLRAQAQGVVTSITGYACACPDTTAPATPGVVLDPFGGTGTTALVASVHGRVGISVDLSADYCRLAQWRTTDAKQREKAARTPKPKKET